MVFRRASTVYSHAGTQAGMSLVEVLVAMFILALASTAIVMTLPKRASALDREVARLETAIARLSDEAIASGETRALRINDNHYTVEVWREGSWIRLTGAEHALPESLSIFAFDVDTPEAWPEVVADATGVVVASGLRLEQGAERRVVHISASGAVQVER